MQEEEAFAMACQRVEWLLASLERLGDVSATYSACSLDIVSDLAYSNIPFQKSLWTDCGVYWTHWLWRHIDTNGTSNERAHCD